MAGKGVAEGEGEERVVARRPEGGGRGVEEGGEGGDGEGVLKGEEGGVREERGRAGRGRPVEWEKGREEGRRGARGE